MNILNNMLILKNFRFFRSNTHFQVILFYSEILYCKEIIYFFSSNHDILLWNVSIIIFNNKQKEIYIINDTNDSCSLKKNSIKAKIINDISEIPCINDYLKIIVSNNYEKRGKSLLKCYDTLIYYFDFISCIHLLYNKQQDDFQMLSTNPIELNRIKNNDNIDNIKNIYIMNLKNIEYLCLLKYPKQFLLKKSKEKDITEKTDTISNSIKYQTLISKEYIVSNNIADSVFNLKSNYYNFIKPSNYPVYHHGINKLFSFFMSNQELNLYFNYLKKIPKDYKRNLYPKSSINKQMVKKLHNLCYLCGKNFDNYMKVSKNKIKISSILIQIFTRKIN